jgi:hypothetical protein
LSEAREAQKEIAQTLDEGGELEAELSAAESALRGLLSSDSRMEESRFDVDGFFDGLRSRLGSARQKTGATSRLSAFRLSPAEKLLTRHRYEFGEEVPEVLSSISIPAHDTNIGRSVVMKIVGEEKISDLLSEARMLGRLEHPNIRPLYELGIDDLGRAFYTVQASKGINLATLLDDLLARKSNATVRFDLKRLLAIFNGVCDAVAFAHAQGLAHGSLGSRKVEVGEFGEVLISGWERAREIDQSNVQAHEADLRADLEGLVDILQHILTLAAPVPGDKKPLTEPHHSWKVPKGLWALARKLRTHRGLSEYPAVKKLQTEVEDYRQELGPGGGRAGAFEAMKQRVQGWQ